MDLFKGDSPVIVLMDIEEINELPSMTIESFVVLKNVSILYSFSL